MITDKQMIDLKVLCKEQPEAMEFVILWTNYCHMVDDIVDGDKLSSEHVIETFAKAVEVFSCPFYLRNIMALRQLTLNIAIAYNDSVKWEVSPTTWQKNQADVYRSFGSEMWIAVATIVGGYEHARNVSAKIRTDCYTEHHDLQGKPI